MKKFKKFMTSVKNYKKSSKSAGNAAMSDLTNRKIISCHVILANHMLLESLISFVCSY